MNSEKIIKLLDLKPLPFEGGYFRETYRSDERIPQSALPDRYTGNRSFGTIIYYLLTKETSSAMHRVKSDEIFHFYEGDPCTMLQLYPDGTSNIFILGSKIDAGHVRQCVVPRGVWQGTIMNEGGNYALMGTSVMPGYDQDDFELGNRDDLIREYPDHADLIRRLTRE